MEHRRHQFQDHHTSIRRVRVNRAEVDEVWDEFLPAQRLYDSFPAGDAYSTVQLLSSQITFLAPQDLPTSAFQTLGLKGIRPPFSPVSYPHTVAYMGFFVDDEARKTVAYDYLQEFVSYIVERDFNNPCLAHLCDLDPKHPSSLDLGDAGVYIKIVQVLQSSSGSASGTGYILTPKQYSESQMRGWILVVFEATTVIQIVRNSWCSSSMENLVRHLVRHGIPFQTLILASLVIPNNIIKLHEAPLNFTTIPPMTRNVMLGTDDYTAYVQLRESIISSPHGRAAFRMGGILWRLAMPWRPKTTLTLSSTRF
jgi:hypothetical protein